MTGFNRVRNPAPTALWPLRRDYKDTNNNVKFGCLKGCAVGQILQMKACRDGRPLDTTENQPLVYR